MNKAERIADIIKRFSELSWSGQLDQINYELDTNERISQAQSILDFLKGFELKPGDRVEHYKVPGNIGTVMFISVKLYKHGVEADCCDILWDDDIEDCESIGYRMWCGEFDRLECAFVRKVDE